MTTQSDTSAEIEITTSFDHKEFCIAINGEHVGRVWLSDFLLPKKRNPVGVIVDQCHVSRKIATQILSALRMEVDALIESVHMQYVSTSQQNTELADSLRKQSDDFIRDLTEQSNRGVWRRIKRLLGFGK